MSWAPVASCKIYTPEALATAIVRALNGDRNAKWLEPSCGPGAFIRSLAKEGVDKDRIFGLDLDRNPSLSDSCGKVLRGREFLKWASDKADEFNRVVGNPPYVRSSKLSEELKRRVKLTRNLDGSIIGGRANLWFAFLLESCRLTSRGGGIGFVLPAAYEFASYAERFRSGIKEAFGDVILIRSRRPLFEQVADGSVILIARRKGESKGLQVRYEVDDVNGAIQLLENLTSSELKHARSEAAIEGCDGPGFVLLSEILKVRIGAVTGDAKYFLLNEQSRKAYGLPVAALQPVLSKSKHLNVTSASSEHWKRLLAQGERVWLFRPRGRTAALKSVGAYLSRKEEEGGCKKNNFKVKARDPWFLTPVPRRFDAFLSGMRNDGLWFCMNEMTGLSVTNTIYGVNFRKRVSRNWKYRWAISLLATHVQSQIRGLQRNYADGLAKLEPSEIGRIQLPVPDRISSPISEYRQLVEFILAGKWATAGDRADQLLLGK
jgi:adenine-specific DNA-methyltransferase